MGGTMAKIRVGFVSNSSSSSFVIHKDKLPAKSRKKLIKAILEWESQWRYCDRYEVREYKNIIKGKVSKHDIDFYWLLNRKYEGAFKISPNGNGWDGIGNPNEAFIDDPPFVVRWLLEHLEKGRELREDKIRVRKQ